MPDPTHTRCICGILLRQRHGSLPHHSPPFPCPSRMQSPRSISIDLMHRVGAPHAFHAALSRLTSHPHLLPPLRRPPPSPHRTLPTPQTHSCISPSPPFPIPRPALAILKGSTLQARRPTTQPPDAMHNAQMGCGALPRCLCDVLFGTHHTLAPLSCASPFLTWRPCRCRTPPVPPDGSLGAHPLRGACAVRTPHRAASIAPWPSASHTMHSFP